MEKYIDVVIPGLELDKIGGIHLVNQDGSILAIGTTVVHDDIYSFRIPVNPVDGRVVTFWKDGHIRAWTAEEADFARSEPNYLFSVPLKNILEAGPLWGECQELKDAYLKLKPAKIAKSTKKQCDIAGWQMQLHSYLHLVKGWDANDSFDCSLVFGIRDQLGVVTHNNKIPWIKEIRHLTLISLKEAKDVVDFLWENSDIFNLD